MQRYTHVLVHIGLNVCVGILSHYEWLSACMHQELHTSALKLNLHVSVLVHTYIVWYTQPSTCVCC